MSEITPGQFVEMLKQSSLSHRTKDKIVEMLPTLTRQETKQLLKDLKKNIEIWNQAQAMLTHKESRGNITRLKQKGLRTKKAPRYAESSIIFRIFQLLFLNRSSCFRNFFLCRGRCFEFSRKGNFGRDITITKNFYLSSILLKSPFGFECFK